MIIQTFVNLHQSVFFTWVVFAGLDFASKKSPPASLYPFIFSIAFNAP